jgi:hypothetical protein
MKLKCLSVFDITASGPEEDYEGFTWEIAEYRYSDSSHSTKDAEWLYAREQAQRFSWALYDNVSKLTLFLFFSSSNGNLLTHTISL